MKLIKDNNGVPEPYSISQLKADYPNVSFRRGYPASQLNQFGAYYVTDTARPVYDNMIETVSEGTPVKVADDWVQVWDVTPLSQAELDARANQVEYDKLAELDRLSIRDIREWIAAQPTAAKTLKDREALAVAARDRIV